MGSLHVIRYVVTCFGMRQIAPAAVAKSDRGPIFADVILKRLIHYTYRIDLRGESTRKRLA